MAPDDAGGYEDFRIRISSGPERYSVRATCRGAAISGTFERPFSDEGLELLILRTQARRGAIRAARRSEGVAAAQEIGERLYGALFHGVVGALLWKESDAVGEGLRITLELSDVPELMDLPWEYLYDPDRGHFLAFSLRTPIVRYLDVPSRQRPLEVAPPLRMLAMVSSPRDVVELNVEHEKELLNDALAELVSRKLVEIDWLENGTRQGLRQKLRRAADRAPYHVFHYIGHGSFEESRGEGFLLFEDAHQRSDPIDGKYLGQMLYEHNSLRLAVLNACEGARAANPLNEPFAGVAARLVRNEIPAVIAMQFEITDDAAALFSKSFYEAIARGEPVDSALVQSRQDLSDADPHGVEWGTPVLFMRVDDGRIFDVADVALSEEAAAAKEPPPMGPEIPPPQPAMEARADARTGMVEVEVGPDEPDQPARPRLEPTATNGTTQGKKHGQWLRGRRVILGSVCLALAGIAVGIATVLGNGGSPSETNAPSIIANLPPGNSSQPAWEPGGMMIAFTVDDERAPGVYVADVDGLSPKGEPAGRESALLAPDGTWPSWASTGRIAYEARSGIWVTDAKRKHVSQLTYDPDSAHPFWSPDGSRVVFSSKRNNGVDRDLFTIGASPDDRAVQRLTRDSDGLTTDDLLPAWSPDGTRITFIRKKPDDDCAPGDLWIVNADGRNAHPLVALPSDERHPTWSPNGRKIVFSSNVDDRGNYDLYTVKADGSHRVRLTRDTDDEVGPSWGADGILYARGIFDCKNGGRSQRLWFLPLRG
jgi:hypothetical protein